MRARLVALLAVGAMAAAACRGGSEATDVPEPSDDQADDRPADESDVADALDDPRWRRVVAGPQARGGEPVSGGDLVVAIEDDANSYLPRDFRGSRAAINVAMALYDPLVWRDANDELRPYLAESLEPNDDFTEWTLTLRPDDRFHDGTPLDADALKRIFDDYLAVDGTETAAALRNVERLDVIDESTVVYVMTQPDTELPELLELPVGWPFSPDAADELGDAFGEQPVGAGPFRFVAWQRDSELVVERNDDYWQRVSRTSTASPSE